jgi:hypothetical protein
MSDQPDQQAGGRSRPDSTGCLPVVLRTMWMTWGNAALVLCAVKMAEGTAPTVSTALFVLFAGGLIGGRYIDITCFKGETAHGEPANLSHWRRYAIAVLFVSAALWVLAKLVSSPGWM